MKITTLDVTPAAPGGMEGIGNFIGDINKTLGNVNRTLELIGQISGKFRPGDAPGLAIRAAPPNPPKEIHPPPLPDNNPPPPVTAPAPAISPEIINFIKELTVGEVIELTRDTKIKDLRELFKNGTK